MSELQGLQSRIEEFRAAGIGITAVCVDPAETNRAVAEEHGLDFPILSDPDLVAIDAFGLRHVAGAMDGSDIARPATYVIRDGEIVWRDLTDNWRVRMRAGDLLEQVEKLDAG